MALSLRGQPNFAISIGRFDGPTAKTEQMHWIKYADAIAGWHITGIFMPVIIVR